MVRVKWAGWDPPPAPVRRLSLLLPECHVAHSYRPVRHVVMTEPSQNAGTAGHSGTYGAGPLRRVGANRARIFPCLGSIEMHGPATSELESGLRGVRLCS